MTAQAMDTVLYQKGEFSIVGINGTGLFDPRQYGLDPAPISSACWRGYICCYRVAYKRLWLKTLDMGLSQEGEDPVPSREALRLFGVAPVRSEFGSSLVYEGIREKVLYTGGLLLGDDFVAGMYVHMGFPPPYKFEKVWELIFDAGHLVLAAGRSAAAAQLRASVGIRALTIPDDKTQGQIEESVHRTFRLEYAW